MHHCSRALNDSEMLGPGLCAQNIRKWLECPSAKAFVQKELLVQSRILNPLLITLCCVLTRVRETCFHKCRH